MHKDKHIILSSYDTCSARVFICLSGFLMLIFFIIMSFVLIEARYAFIIVLILVGFILLVTYLSLNKKDTRVIFVESTGLRFVNWKNEEIFVCFQEISSVEIDTFILNSFHASIKLKTENAVFNIKTNIIDSYVSILKALPDDIKKVFLRKSENLYVKGENVFYKYMRIITAITFILSFLFIDIKLMLDLIL